jgi:hypothetical protein
MLMIGLTFGLTVGSTFGSTVSSTFSLTVSSTFSLTVGLTVGSPVGSTVSLTWLCWAINLSKAFDSSDQKLNNLVVLQALFTGSSFYRLLTAISQEVGKGYYKSDITLWMRG